MIELKTQEQIEKIRESGCIIGDLYKELKTWDLVGKSTKEIDKYAYDFIIKRKGIPAFKGYNGFPATLCMSVNEAVIHGIPNDNTLQEGDILSIDCGVILDGFYSDSAITLAVGKVSQEVSDLLFHTEQSLYKAIEALKEGARIKDIGIAVEKYIKPLKYGIVRDYTGHGVGFALHEDPQIPNYNFKMGPNPRLKEGMVLAIEPMINLGTEKVKVLSDDWTVVTKDKSYSAHFEHTVAFIKGKPEILTLAR